MVKWVFSDLSPETLLGLYKLCRVSVVPSAHLQLYENSSRTDAAHLRGRIRGIYQSLYRLTLIKTNQYWL